MQVIINLVFLLGTLNIVPGYIIKLPTKSSIENVEDTLTILNKYVDSMDIQGKKKPLTDLMTSLYNEALDEHTYL